MNPLRRVRRIVVDWPHLRDRLLFFGGLAGVAHETIVFKGERPNLLILFAAMMSTPIFSAPYSGRRRNGGRKKED